MMEPSDMIVKSAEQKGHRRRRRHHRRRVKSKQDTVNNDLSNQLQQLTVSKKKNNDETVKRKKKKKQQENVEEENFDEYLSEDCVTKGLENGTLICGILRINPKLIKHSYIANPIKNQADILMETIKDRNRALDGDEVCVRLLLNDDTNEQQKRATVVYIKNYLHNRLVVGCLKKQQTTNGRNHLWFYPRDLRVPRVKIHLSDSPLLLVEDCCSFLESHLFLVKITEWKRLKYANGQLLECIGQSGDLLVESSAILKEYGLSYDQVCHFDYFIPSSEFTKRLDLRDECIFTIDPQTAKDLDDAVSCKVLPNGNYEIGVHISDVSYFVREHTKLDEIALERGTSTYMVNTVHHMLPTELCFGCSLLPGQDRLAISVLWEMSPNGRIMKRGFARTVIRSSIQLSYEHVQEMIKTNGSSGSLPPIQNDRFTQADIIRTVLQLNRVARCLRFERYRNGALRIDQTKITFALNGANGLPESFTVYEHNESHQLIEEFMLLANVTVAEKLQHHFPDIALLRSHPPPSDYMLKTFQSSMEMIGIHLDISSAASLQHTLAKYYGKNDDFLSHSRMLVLNALAAKTMNRAIYFCANNSTDIDSYWHYALNIPLYTHFTSPIRRYADIMVHRALCVALGYMERPSTSTSPGWTVQSIQNIANICNVQKYRAKRAGDKSIELYYIIYVGLREPLVETAVVADVKDNSFDSIIISSGFTVRIYFKNLDENIKCEFVDHEETTKQENNKKLLSVILHWPQDTTTTTTTTSYIQQTIAIFSIVNVILTKQKQDKTLKLEATLAKPITTTILTSDSID